MVSTGQPTPLTVQGLAEAAPCELGTSEWLTISQEQIDGFAEATGDRQWIHVDPERAATGPFGTTVAHGFLTLSLLPSLMPQVLLITDRRMTVNYGVEKVRFTSPVPVGSRVRLRASLLAAEPRGEGVQMRLGVQIEIEGREKPALVGESLTLVYGGADA